ncbi:MAG: hypothetical protein L6435_04100, partial [Anaerolineae bacterium]|nr:hypothetical protein [Anaerolineae bacterium]
SRMARDTSSTTPNNTGFLADPRIPRSLVGKDRLPPEYCGRRGAIASGRAAISPGASSRQTLWCSLATHPSDRGSQVRAGMGSHYRFKAHCGMFHSAQAVLLTKNLSLSSHEGVVSAIGERFVKAGILPEEMTGGLSRAFDKRQIGHHKAILIRKEEHGIR